MRDAFGRAARLWVGCPGCGAFLEREVLRRRLGVCDICGHHFPLEPRERARFIFDAASFVPREVRLRSADPLRFASGGYAEELDRLDRESVIYGTAAVLGAPCVVVLMDFGAFGGSLGVVAGELFCRACEEAAAERVPLLAFTSSGGARMQEGTPALLQMAKTLAALESTAGRRPGYVALLCHPTCGGVTASFATAADVILAEPGALICFSGPRVVEQTTGIRLPEGFSRAEEHQERGLVDMVVPRGRQREVLGGLLAYLGGGRSRRGLKAPLIPESE